MHQLHNNTTETDQYCCTKLHPQRIAKHHGACSTPSSGGSGRSGRRPPHRTTEAQKRVLLAEFENNPNPPAKDRDRIAKLLNVERRIVKNWFSNQRALRRKTGQGYPGRSFWRESSSGSRSSCRSDDDWERDEVLRRPPEHSSSCGKQDRDSDEDLDSDIEDTGADRSVVLRTYMNPYPTSRASGARRDGPYPKDPFVLLQGGGGHVYGLPVAGGNAFGRRHRPPSPFVHIPCPQNAVPRDFKPSISLAMYEAPLLSRYPESALRSSLGAVGVVTVP